MKSKTLYPKTRRVKVGPNSIEITEKLDGSNLCLFRKGYELIIAQRNNVYTLSELERDRSLCTYKGLYGWLMEHGDTIAESLYDGSGVCGEWIGTGKIGYGKSDISNRYYIYAKARLEGDSIEDYKLNNIFYSHNLIPYAFLERNIPSCIKLVPIISKVLIKPTKETLDMLYEKYTDKLNRRVEGFIVNDNESITKYVRYKSGKMTEHFDNIDD